MNATKILAAVLGVQVLLAAITWWPRDAGPVSQPLLPFEVGAVTAISIESETTRALDDTIRLEKKEGSWVVANQYDFPADASKVEELIEKLADLKTRLPIATTAVRHGQLNVLAENATRHLVVTAGDQSVEIFAGIAGGNRLNVRLAGNDDVFDVSGLGAWSIRDNATAFYDKRILDVDPATLDSFSMENGNGTFALTKSPEGVWSSAGLDEGLALDPRKLTEMFNTVLTLDLFEPYDPAEPDPLENPVVTVSWSVTEDGQSNASRYGAYPVDREIALRIEGQPRAVKMAPGRVAEMLATMSLAALVVEPAE